jgi:hypothetical protein
LPYWPATAGSVGASTAGSKKLMTTEFSPRSEDNEEAEAQFLDAAIARLRASGMSEREIDEALGRRPVAGLRARQGEVDTGSPARRAPSF